MNEEPSQIAELILEMVSADVDEESAGCALRNAECRFRLKAAASDAPFEPAESAP